MIGYIIASVFLGLIVVQYLSAKNKDKQINDLKLAKNESELKIRELENQNTKLQEEYTSLSKELEAIKNKYNDLNVSHSVLQEKINNYEKSIAQLEEEKKILSQTNKIQQENITNLEKEISQSQTRLKEISTSLIEKKELYEQNLKKLEDEKQKTASENRELNDKIVKLVKELSELQTKITEEKKNTREKLELLQKARDELSEAFENLSNKILDQRLDKLEKSNLSGLRAVLEPFKMQIKDFKERLETIGSQQVKEQGKLLNELQNLKNLNEKLSQEASNLTKALKGDKKIQGNWGEMRLKRIFESSGLQEGIEYELQKSITDETGKRYIPDAIVHLPNQRDIIIDSKVSLVSFEKYFSAESDLQKEKHLKNFTSAIKNHIKELADKSYERLPNINSLDYVIMFIPIESAYLLAIHKDMDMFDFAVKNRIMLVSPSTLLLALKTVANLWKIEQQNRNIKEIVKRGEILYNKFVSFVEKLRDIGNHIDKAKESYDNTIKLLSTGRGNLISQAEKLKKLGINSNKTIKNLEFFEE